jgi:hypothetical protein
MAVLAGRPGRRGILIPEPPRTPKDAFAASELPGSQRTLTSGRPGAEKAFGLALNLVGAPPLHADGVTRRDRPTREVLARVGEYVRGSVRPAPRYTAKT